MKIEKIIYSVDKEKNVFNNCIIYYEDGSSEITNDVLGAIFKFMNQEGLTLEKVMKDPRVELNEFQKDSKKEKAVPIVNETHSSDSDKVEETKGEERSSRKTGVKLLALVSALVIGGVAVDFVLNKEKSKLFQIFGKKPVIEQSATFTPKPETIVTPTAIVTEAPTPYITPIVTAVPTEVPTPYVTEEPIQVVSVEDSNTQTDEEYNETFRENVGETIENVDPLTRNIIRLNNGERLSEEELFDTINGINRLCQANMAEVEKLIEGGNMSGDKIFPLFDVMFPEGSIEYEVISSFTSRRNMLVDDAYNGDRALTTSDVNDYNDFFLDFIFGNVTFEHNGNRYGYYDISPIARYIVFMLGQTTLETNHAYSKDINGNMCDFNTIISELEENYNLITSQLFESGRVR